jgi:methyltransferase OMS1, mitochondrial
MTTSSNAVRKVAVLIAGGGAFGAAAYLSYHYQQMDKASSSQRKNQPPHGTGFSYVSNPDRNQQFQQLAACYDDAIGRDELYMGVNVLRRALLFFHARGTCLEVGAGTGRNIPYYRLSSNVVHRVVMADSSDHMLQQAKAKVQKLTPPELSARFALLQANAESIDLPDNAFDTVIDTFGLCSYNDPVLVLKELARLCKPNGKILLLEHGRSHTWAYVTRHLDAHAEQHASNWGCVWNRDLDALLEAAGESIEVKTIRRFHFGTTYYVVCQPKEARRGDKQHSSIKSTAK